MSASPIILEWPVFKSGRCGLLDCWEVSCIRIDKQRRGNVLMFIWVEGICDIMTGDGVCDAFFSPFSASHYHASAAAAAARHYLLMPEQQHTLMDRWMGSLMNSWQVLCQSRSNLKPRGGKPFRVHTGVVMWKKENKSNFFSFFSPPPTPLLHTQLNKRPARLF